MVIIIDARFPNPRARPLESEEEARRIGRRMAERTAKRVRLKLPT